MFRTILLTYSGLYFIFLILYLPVVIFQAVFRRKKTCVLARIKPGPIESKPSSGRKRIWIHAVSVGEVNASLALIRRLVSSGYQVILSTTTVTGQQVARSAVGDSVTLIYFPLDFKIICRAYLRKMRPDLIALMETEIWPNFLESANRERIPVIFINGRISDRSFRNYLRIAPLLSPVFDRISIMCMQSEIDADRIRKIGAPSELLRVTGNMKFDYHLEIPPAKRRLQEQLDDALRRKPGGRIWLCGSTKPNEEELIAGVLVNLKNDFPGLALLIAPRHPHRGEEVEGIFRERGFTAIRRSVMKPGVDYSGLGLDVLVLDTVGELACLYQIPDVVFMGGSLVPTGGQNVIEPAFFGKPILFGPSMTNFREIAEIFKARNAAIQIGTPSELESSLRLLLPDEKKRAELGQNARMVLEDNRGAVDRNISLMEAIINP